MLASIERERERERMIKVLASLLSVVWQRENWH